MIKEIAKQGLINQEKKPHLRIAVTPDCNFSCLYCRDGGEGILTNEIMSASEMLKVLEISSQVGFKHLKITGGEPLLREKKMKDVIPLIKEVVKNKYFDDIQMVTNGSLLNSYVEDLINSGLNSLTVSLDAADSKKFKQITGRDEFGSVIEGIKNTVSSGLPVILNTVIFDRNLCDVPRLIKLAKSLKVKIKFLDYVEFKNTDEANYICYTPFDLIYSYVRNISEKEFILFPPGGLGTPMTTFVLDDGTEVIIKDATVGTNYNVTCKFCSNYPCQDALISLRITANGALKRCLIRDDNLVNIYDELKSGNLNFVKEKLKESYDILINTEYIEAAWTSVEKLQMSI
jgi:molybdenum cofactor biosynthesis enzyme MoaA